jgi:hypothetical protein
VLLEEVHHNLAHGKSPYDSLIDWRRLTRDACTLGRRHDGRRCFAVAEGCFLGWPGSHLDVGFDIPEQP